MLVNLIGETDKRPFTYTLLKLFQFLGDVMVITSNPQYGRLIMDRDYELLEIDGVLDAGHFQNIFIIVTTLTLDALEEQGVVIGDCDFTVIDNKVEKDTPFNLFIKGQDISQRERDMIEYLEEVIEIEFGFGKKPVRYSLQMFKNVETVESKHVLIPIDKGIAKMLVKIFAKHLNKPEGVLMKGVFKK